MSGLRFKKRLNLLDNVIIGLYIKIQRYLFSKIISATNIKQHAGEIEQNIN